MKLLTATVFIHSYWKHNKVFEVEITITLILKYCSHNFLKDPFLVSQGKKK